LGKLAFIQDNVLWVETATGSGEFVEIGRYAQTAAWSPNGSQLAYSIVITSDFFDNPDAIFEQRLWSAADGSDISLAELIVNYPNPPYHVTNMFWTPDGTKILLQAQLDERHEDAILRLNDYLLVAANLSQKTLSDIKFIYSLQRPV
jgi:hypothetical protein